MRHKFKLALSAFLLVLSTSVPAWAIPAWSRAMFAASNGARYHGAFQVNGANEVGVTEHDYHNDSVLSRTIFIRPSGAGNVVDASTVWNSLKVVLWNSSGGRDGKAWLTDSTYNTSFPFTHDNGWAPVRVTGCGLSVPCIMWQHTDGRVQIWRVNNGRVLTKGPIIGPLVGWEAVEIYGDPAANSLFMIWREPAPGKPATIWRMTLDGQYQSQVWFTPPANTNVARASIDVWGGWMRVLFVNSSTRSIRLGFVSPLGGGISYLSSEHSMANYSPVDVAADSGHSRVLWAENGGTGRYAIQTFSGVTSIRITHQTYQ
jgi:hypothetical protein